jgi:hypothetical protein
MAENTEEQPIDGPENTPSEKPSEEITPTNDTKTINPKKETENMEVHKHPRHVMHKKKWGEYMLEFFMLFLAVFLGFVAENIREHKVEKDRELQYVQSLADDIKKDRQALDSGIKKTILQINGKDSFVLLIQRGIKTPMQSDSFYNFHWKYMGYVIEIPFSKGTMNQLLNAGGLRLVRNEKISKAIADYAANVDYHEKIRQPQYINENYIALQASQKFIDIRFMRALPDDKYTRAPYEQTILRNNDTDQLHDFSFAIEMDKENCILFVQDLERLQKIATELLNLLKKEYHLEDD